MQFGGELFSKSPKNRWTTPLMYEGRIKYLFSEASRPSGARKSFARASISRFLTVLKVPRCINVRKYDTVRKYHISGSTNIPCVPSKIPPKVPS